MAAVRLFMALAQWALAENLNETCESVLLQHQVPWRSPAAIAGSMGHEDGGLKDSPHLADFMHMLLSYVWHMQRKHSSPRLPAQRGKKTYASCGS